MNGLQKDYERIVRPLEDRMIHSIWRVVRHPSDAEDALQNALQRFGGHWDRVVKHPNPEVLIFKICLTHPMTFSDAGFGNNVICEKCLSNPWWEACRRLMQNSIAMRFMGR